MHRSDVLRRVARTYPAICRPPVRLVAGSRLSCHWLVNALLRDLGIYDTTPAYLESLDLFVPRALVDAYRHFEPLTRQAFRHTLLPGRTVVDVAARAGSYTVLAAHAVGRRGTVYAVEPDPDSRLLLVRNVRRQRLHNVVVPDMELRAKPLDEVIPGPVDVVRIDVEGAEIEMLQGAERLLRGSAGAVVFVKWNPGGLAAAGHDPADLPARLQALGFSRLRVLDDRAGQERELDAALAELRSGRPEAAFWSATLWASEA
ncbi:MAG TPA: FkbM family methyltransferase [Methylomirabilota bacterium]|jgi:hypothetical protein